MLQEMFDSFVRRWAPGAFGGVDGQIRRLEFMSELRTLIRSAQQTALHNRHRQTLDQRRAYRALKRDRDPRLLKLVEVCDAVIAKYRRSRGEVP